MNYYTSTGSQEVLGPFSVTELTARHASGELPANAQVCAEGTQLWQPILAVITGPKPTPGSPPPPPPPIPMQGDSTGGLIPYKNPQALTAYYLGIFGLFPVLGLFLAIPAFILGIIGLKKKKQNPVIKGSVHAWIGIILGALSALYNVPLTIAVIVALVNKK